MREENRERREARLCGKNWHRSGPEEVGDPPLYLAPMDLHLVQEALGGSEQVSTIGEDREHQAIGKAVAQMRGDAFARVREVSNTEAGGLG